MYLFRQVYFILTVVLLTIDCHVKKKCKVIRFMIRQSCLLTKLDPYSSLGSVFCVLGRGQAEVTQVGLLFFHLPLSDWADDPKQTHSQGSFLKYFTRQCMFQETWNEIQIIMILLIPTSSSSRDTKLAHADTVLFFLPFCALFKETFH